MPFALILVGIVLLVAAVRNTVADDSSGNPGLLSLVKNDLSGGPGSFQYWLVAILVIGAIGYIKPLAPLSRVFLALVVVVLFLRSGGFYQKFNAQVFGQGLSSNLSGEGAPAVAQQGTGTAGMGTLATPQPWAQNYQLPTDLGIEVPLAPARPN